jgi:hypothetical protein
LFKFLKTKKQPPFFEVKGVASRPGGSRVTCGMLAPAAAVNPTFFALAGPISAPSLCCKASSRRVVGMLPMLIAAALAPTLAPPRSCATAHTWSSWGQGGSAGSAVGADFAVGLGRAHAATALSAMGGRERGPGSRGGNMGRGRGPQFGQTPRTQESSTLSLDEFMAMSSRLDDPNDQGPREGQWGASARQARGGAKRAPSRTSRRDSAAALETKPGDWTCPECGINNFARNSNCFRCSAPKPPTLSTENYIRRSTALERGEAGDAAAPSTLGAGKSADYSRAGDERDPRDDRRRDLLASSRGMYVLIYIAS